MKVIVPSKVILFGEYAVCKNSSAIVSSSENYKTVLNVVVTRSDNDDISCKNEFISSILPLAKDILFTLFPSKISFHQLIHSVEIIVDENIPIGIGFGSSSSIIVAVCLVLSRLYSVETFTKEEIFELSYKTEKTVFKTDQISGVDVAGCIYGGCFIFDGETKKIKYNYEDLSFLRNIQLHYQTESCNRHKTNIILPNVLDIMTNNHIMAINDIVHNAHNDIRSKQYHSLREYMSMNQSILDCFMIGNNPTNDPCAKLSGSGLGGLYISYIEDRSKIEGDFLTPSLYGCRIEEVDIPIILEMIQAKIKKSNILDHCKYYAEAPSNIALIKYWGKTSHYNMYYQKQLPRNSSISLTLPNLLSKTTVWFSKGKRELYPEIIKNNQKLKWLLDRINVFDDFHIDFSSENTFPTGCGIASSASGTAALVNAISKLYKLETVLSKQELHYWKSQWSRLGSGSACRSILDITSTFVIWNQDASNTVEELRLTDDNLKHCVVVLNEKPKKVSSHDGHNQVDTSIIQMYRETIANTSLQNMIYAIKTGNWKRVGEICENDTMLMHSVMCSSEPKLQYITTETIQFVRKFIMWRDRMEKENDQWVAFFTIDAGPNPHIIYNSLFHEQVVNFINL